MAKRANARRDRLGQTLHRLKGTADSLGVSAMAQHLNAASPVARLQIALKPSGDHRCRIRVAPAKDAIDFCLTSHGTNHTQVLRGTKVAEPAAGKRTLVLLPHHCLDVLDLDVNCLTKQQ